jgi:hypothetical protein
LGAKPKQAGKKEGGWGEGIFARLLPFPSRLRKGKAEGGFGGNSAFPLRNQIEASPATCPNTWRAEHRRKILFSLKEKEIGRAQNEKSKEYFSVVWRACRAVAGLASLLGVLLKKCSNINQKTPQKKTVRQPEAGQPSAEISPSPQEHGVRPASRHSRDRFAGRPANAGQIPPSPPESFFH